VLAFLAQFGEGRPLGERGLRWLKIHLANLVGNSVDKLSFDEREKYCNDNMEEVSRPNLHSALVTSLLCMMSFLEVRMLRRPREPVSRAHAW
jgi:hypothetical protein